MKADEDAGRSSHPELSGYRIDRVLGSGGMGVVYLAHDQRLRRDVALKVLPSEVAGNSERMARFRREAQSLAALNHPNIVTIYSVEEDGGTTFLTMERVQGRTLDLVIPSEGLPAKRFLDLAIQMADALAAAEQAGITHRDLKPTNLMVSEDGRVKLIDLGLVKLVEQEDPGSPDASTLQETAPGKVLGSPAYMAPEQIEGKPVDHRSDIFSLGVVFYEMISGRRPFTGTNGATLMTSILRDEPRPLIELIDDVPAEIARIIRRCLEKEPTERFQAALDIRNDLRDVQGSFLTSQSSPSLEPPGKAPTTWTRSLPIALALVVLVGVGLFFLNRDSDPPESGGESGEGRLLPALAPLAPKRWSSSEGVEKWAQWSPDGGTVAFAMEVDGYFQIFTRPTAGGEPRPITQGGRDHIMPSWAPDGQRIAFVRARIDEDRPQGKLDVSDIYGGYYSRGGDLWTARVDGTDARLLVKDAFSPTYNKAGKLAFSREIDGALQIWTCNEQGGQLDALTPNESAISHVEPTWSPDGSMLAFRRQADKYGSEIAVTRVGSRVLEAVTPVGLHSEPVWSPDGQMIYYVTNPGTGFNIWRLGVDEEGRSDGSKPQQVTFGPGPDINPALSPDGTSLFFSIVPWNSDLWLLPVDPESGEHSGEPYALLTSSGQDSRGSFSADEKIMTFCSTRNGTMSIYTAPFDPATGRAGAPVQVTEGGLGGHYQPTISGDGRQITYFGRSDANEDIFRVTIGPDLKPLGPPVRLTTHPASDHSPFISPDGDHIAFRSMRSGSEQLWLMKSDGTNLRQLTTSGSFGHFTPWYDAVSVVTRTRDVRDEIPEVRSFTARFFIDGREREILGVHGGGHITLSPSREWLVDNNHETIHRARLRQREREEIDLYGSPDGEELDYTVWMPSGRWILFDRNSARGGDIFRIEGLTKHGD